MYRSAMGAASVCAPPPRCAMFTTSSLRADEVADRCGDEGYSYFFVQKAFLPLLERWADVEEVSGDSLNFRHRLAAARRDGNRVVHLSFLPLQHLRLADHALNIAFPFWEYPDIPATDVAGQPRNNWARTAEGLDLILTACEFTRQAFLRARVTRPIEVVPVPVASAYFSIAPWQPEERVHIACPAYLLPQAKAVSRVREVARKVAAWAGLAAADHLPIPFAADERLELSGVVYSTVLNPFDERKNWREIIRAFLYGLGDKSDALLVVKLAASRSMSREALHNVLHFYRRLQVKHACRLAVTAAYLSDEQMGDLVRGSTYYVNASRAEGACLPLAAALAAGRPGIAPAHTAMAEYIDENVAFVVPSQPKPTCWPIDPAGKPSTTWHEIAQDDLAKQFRISYEVARRDLPRYRVLASEGRQRMHALASEESVSRRLSQALGARSWGLGAGG